MSLFDGTPMIVGSTASQAGFQFPASLSERYRPHSLADFVGLEKPKRVLAKFADAPFPNAAFLFVGPSGTGKTSMALALCEAIRGELHHIPSQSCNLATLEDVVRQCHYVPRYNSLHVVLVDEADAMTSQAQLAFLSKLDGRHSHRRLCSSSQRMIASACSHGSSRAVCVLTLPPTGWLKRPQAYWSASGRQRQATPQNNQTFCAWCKTARITFGTRSIVCRWNYWRSDQDRAANVRESDAGKAQQRV